MGGAFSWKAALSLIVGEGLGTAGILAVCRGVVSRQQAGGKDLKLHQVAGNAGFFLSNALHPFMQMSRMAPQADASSSMEQQPCMTIGPRHPAGIVQPRGVKAADSFFSLRWEEAPA